ncbi:MAG: hypothetical protein ACK52I_13355 [Pseudomonadota bacterium]|jgi:hypothetical protein
MSIYSKRKTTDESAAAQAEHEITRPYLERRIAEQQREIIAGMVRAQGWRMDWSPHALKRLREDVRDVDMQAEILIELQTKLRRLHD